MACPTTVPPISTSDPASRPAAAIVGGGFSGTMAAAQLARHGIASVLIDGSGRAGLGTAYSTPDAAHLLNVRAESMSAWPDEPAHFADWWAAEGGEPRGFAPRRDYGRYLRSILTDALDSGLVRLIESDAIAAGRSGSGWRIALAGGNSLDADRLILATGNQPPGRPPWAESLEARFIADPWGAEAQAAIARAASEDAPILILGTGLTMVDLVLSLDGAGHRGPIVALSRRGLAPRSHADFAPAPVDDSHVPAGLLPLWAWLRRRGASVGWRAAVDSLRPHAHAIWRGLSLDEKRRFLRHARPWWDVHRHRIAPEIAARLREIIAEGRLEVRAGKLGSVRPEGERIVAEVRGRGEKALNFLEAAWLFNCTGPLGDIASTRDPLLRGLLDAGDAKPDPLGIGLDVDDQARAGPGVWALGPLTKGRCWEIVAVPDIRGQAAKLADSIASEIIPSRDD